MSTTEYDTKSHDVDSERGIAQRSFDGKTSALDVHMQAAVAREIDAHVGVKRVQAAEKVYGKYSKWILFISYVDSLAIVVKETEVNGVSFVYACRLGLASYIYSLDGQVS